jgi:hypothetical protein
MLCSAATLEDMKNATQSEPERFATAFGYLDLAQHPALKRGPLGSVKSKIGEGFRHFCRVCPPCTS